ncbi:MAG: tetratricopeptide repeat protein [Deltaproteobacteria bacterium]|nr:tetratricopeptide repeat protein [Deltaproteobacteria bacterium]
MKTAPVIHPFLLAIYPALFLFTHNIGELPYNALLTPLAIAITFSLLSWSVLRFFLKDSHKSGIVVSLFIVLFFSYGHFDEYIGMIFIIWPALFIIGTYFSLKKRKHLQNITRFMNVIAVMLIVISLIQIGIFQFKKGVASPGTRNIHTAEKKPKIDKGPEYLPNILFIILDAYARVDVLEEIYGYDNSEFLKFLAEKGFFTANKSTANYNQTSLTVASCLNMTYLNDLVGKLLPTESNDRRPLWKMIRYDNRVFHFLKQRGYKIASFASGIEDTEIRNADLYLKSGWTLNGFQNALINTTPMPSALRLLKTTNQFDIHRERVEYILDHLVPLSKEKSPIFVFAHIEVPHTPFVFGPNGEKRYPEKEYNDNDGDWLIHEGRLTREQYIKGYVDQLLYINKRMTTVINGILSQSKSPPIIILFSDHGPRSLLFWEDPKKTYMKECMSNLNSFFFPDGNYSQLYDEITPVNTFRVIFNQFFDTDLKLLPDNTYYSTAKYCYKFYDVKDRVQNPKNKTVHSYLGIASAERGDFEKSLYHFMELLRIDPADEGAHNNLGVILIRKGIIDEAVAHFREALRIRPNFTLAKNNLKRALANHGRMDSIAEKR